MLNLSRLRVAPVTALVAAIALVGCAPLPSLTKFPEALPCPGYVSPLYQSRDLWVCRGDDPADPCHGDLSSTELRADGSRALKPSPTITGESGNADTGVDCFYVYPTVDLGILSGNHTDFSDRAPMTAAAVTQAARFRSVCRVFAPLYRQITIGTYVFSSDAARDARLDVAFSDVADAFAQYLTNDNHGRKIVLLGHSQGAEMVVRLVQHFFEHDAGLRAQLLVAMAIGRPIEVPKGKLTGGTFASTPYCTQRDEIGCVVAYQTQRTDRNKVPDAWLPKPGNETVCVNPTSVHDNSRQWFAGTYVPYQGQIPLRDLSGITTPFVAYRNFYAAQCMDGPDGYRFLGVSVAPVPGDSREGLFQLGALTYTTSLGTHVLDVELAEEDLISSVAARLGNVGGRP
jgi:hypothetical protein